MERHLGRRALAYTIDSCFSIIVTSLAFCCVGGAVLASPDPDRMTLVGGLIAGSGVLVFGGLGFAYLLVRDGLNKGSFGKRMSGLRVVDARSGAPCSMKQSLIRNFVLLVLGAFDLLIPFLRSDGRRLGDEAAGTRVERVGRRPTW